MKHSCLAIILAAIAASAVAETLERPFMIGCGRYTGRWLARPHSYDARIWDHMAAMGVQMTGCGLPWGDAEPQRGRFARDVIDYADFEVEAILDRGMEPFFFLGLTPGWAALHPELPPHRSPPREDALEDFLNFHRFVAQRYRGRVRYYAFWNEPNGCSWIADGCRNADDAAHYTRWLIRCSQVIKEVDPNARIIAGRLDYHEEVTDGYKYLETMYAHGAGPHIDGVAIHPYDKDGDLHWRAIQDTRAVMVRNNDAHKGVWLTEYGWALQDEADKSRRLLATLKALEDPQWHYVVHANYLVLNDGPGVEHYGLTNRELRPRPSYFAFRNYLASLEPDFALRNASFEEHNGYLGGWQIVPRDGHAPDLPALTNENAHGPRTTHGARFGGKVTNGERMDFSLGQVLRVRGDLLTASRIDCALTAHVQLHAAAGEEARPENVRQVWEVGWNDDGGIPTTIDACDHYLPLIEIDAAFTSNDRAAFLPLAATASIETASPPRHVALRVRMYNREAVEWSMSNVDSVDFQATSVRAP